MQLVVLVMSKLQQKTKWHTISWNLKEFAAVYRLLAWDSDKIFPGMADRS